MEKYRNTYGKISPLPQLTALDLSLSLPLSYTSCYTLLHPIATQVQHEAETYTSVTS